MKKFVLLMLILGLTSVSQAGLIWLEINGSQEYAAAPGDTVHIQLKADTACSGLAIDGIVEGDGPISSAQINWGGQVLSATLDSAFTIITDPGYIDNYLGGLYSALGVTAPTPAAAGVVLLDLEYQIDAAWDETPYWVSPLEKGKTYTYGAGLDFPISYNEGNLAAVWVDVTGVHIVPEPMTISLLGLGGLFALRRRKK